MPLSTLNTYFASPEKNSDEELKNQMANFSDKDLFAYLLDSTPNYLIVLNKNRQIVFANKAMRELFDSNGYTSLYGLRPGEVLNCKNAFMEQGGCGTSEFCRTCGAVNAILSSLKGEEDVQECRIIRKDDEEALDLRVWTRPLELKGEQYSIFTFMDISHEKRRMALERIFFHDVLNTAGGIKSFLNIIQEASKEEIDDLKILGTELADRLVEEIKAQRDLTLAENRELEVKLQICIPKKLISETVNLYKNHVIAQGMTITVCEDIPDLNFISDAALISRVLGNMLKNALESSCEGDEVKIDFKATEEFAVFSVHNKSFIPKDIQMQIFNRSFSTKGEDRGLGTYGMKLLTERYLKGKVYFVSDKIKGTTFYAEYPLKFNG